jgi:hypothetical protein
MILDLQWKLCTSVEKAYYTQLISTKKMSYIFEKIKLDPYLIAVTKVN